MKNAQPGILAPIPRHARYLTFGLKQGVRPQVALRALAAIADGESCVVGLGAVMLFLSRVVMACRSCSPVKRPR